MDCAIRNLCFGRHEIDHAGIRNFRRAKYSRKKFEKDSNSLTHQQLDSQKWAEEGRKRNYYRLSLPSFSFSFPPVLIFERPTLSRLPQCLRAWNRLPYRAPVLFFAYY